MIIIFIHRLTTDHLLINNLMMTGDDISDAAEIRWKLGPTHPKAKCLLMRLATKSKYHA